MRTFVFIPIAALLIAVSGCSKPPEFSHRDEYSELEPYAQEYVQTLLDTYFGEPTDMVVWDRLPLKLHTASGTVSDVQERQVTLDLSEPHGEIVPGMEILWMNGAETAAESSWVRSWDEGTHTVTLESPVDATAIAEADATLGPGQILANGRQLFAEHCLHCHGVTGDGQGSTAQYLNPRPRDYRKGIFKFTTTQASERVSREDLARTIEIGIPGTYMPSFKLLTEAEMTSIVEYVLWLSMRGEVEYQMVRFLADSYSQEAVRDRVAEGQNRRKAGDEDYETYDSIRQEFYDAVNDPDEFEYMFEQTVDLIVERTKNAQLPEALVAPGAGYPGFDAESAKRGRQLFLSADLNCAACHGEGGFGDGPQTYTITKNTETGDENEQPGLYDTWGNPLEPRNLHTGIYRGGRRPIDLYCRVHAGIKGTPMPAFGAKLEDQQIWDIVNYIYSVPFESVEAGSGTRLPTPPAEAAEVATK